MVTPTLMEKAGPVSRDYSQFMPDSPPPKPAVDVLRHLGWHGFFASQLDADALTQTPPVRVTAVHRNTLHVMGRDVDQTIRHAFDATVGDWLLFDAQTQTATRLLERTSLIKRRAPGHDVRIQMIAANLDTAFIVTSCNNDFNVARLERYVALAMDADITPVIVLTKPDLCDNVQSYVSQAEAISNDLAVVHVDARTPAAADVLAPWCQLGQTVAFLGSSGVGKSTLANALAGSDAIKTQEARVGDDRGRHTTTHRQLHLIEGGCAVLDTPGMRELQLTDVAHGVDSVFSDLRDLSHACKFNDCAHLSEPGCAVRRAVETGDLDPERVERWRKLVAEEAFNTQSLQNSKAKNKALSKTIKKPQTRNPK